MGALTDRVAVVTGAATSGIGREHALLLAREGAAVVVNQPIELARPEVAEQVDRLVAKIRDEGGTAVASTDDVSTWAGARAVIELARSCFGRLDVLVNNFAGWRNNSIADMQEDEWDEVIRIHLKGHFAPLRWAATYWRNEAEQGRLPRASVVNTSSPSGLFGRPRQANYGAAKAGIAALTIIAAHELARYGVRVNAIAPAARIDPDAAPPDDGQFDPWDPAHVSPLVAYLASDLCEATGKTYFVQGGKVQLLTPWGRSQSIERHGRWSVADLHREMGPLTSIL